MTTLTIPGGGVIIAEQYPTLTYSHALEDDGTRSNPRVILTREDGKQLVFEGDRAERVMELMKEHYRRSVEEANGDLLLSNSDNE